MAAVRRSCTALLARLLGPVLHAVLLLLVLGVPVLGAVAGAVSGTLPAIQATKVNPAELLRST